MATASTLSTWMHEHLTKMIIEQPSLFERMTPLLPGPTQNEFSEIVRWKNFSNQNSQKTIPNSDRTTSSSHSPLVLAGWPVAEQRSLQYLFVTSLVWEQVGTGFLIPNFCPVDLARSRLAEPEPPRRLKLKTSAKSS